MQITPYLSFKGNCAEAFRFYEKVLGGQIVMMMTHGESPIADQIPSDAANSILHARLIIGNAVLMGSDAPADAGANSGFCVSLIVDTSEEAERIFGSLSDGGSIECAMAETFWATRFGMCTDRFGTPWMVNCEKSMQ